MAKGRSRTTAKTKTAGKSTAAKKSSTSRNTKETAEVYTDYRVGQEIRICIVAACAVLLMLGNFGFGGKAGEVASNVLFGLFGLGAWIFPLVLFFAFAFYIANSLNPLIVRKMIGLILLFIFTCAFVHLLTLGYEKTDSILSYYTISSEDHTGGGLFGGFFIFIFGYAFSAVGAYVLTVCGLIISAIMLTQRPLISDVGRTGRKIRRRQIEKRRAAMKERVRREREEAYEEEEHTFTPLEMVTLEQRSEHKKADKKRGTAQKKESASKTSASKKTPAKTAEMKPELTESAEPKADKFEMEQILPKEKGMPAFEFRDITIPEIDDGSSSYSEGTDFTMPTFLEYAKTASTDEKPLSKEPAGLFPTDEPLFDNQPSSEILPNADEVKTEEEEKPEKLKPLSPEEKQKGIDHISLEIAEGEKEKPEYKFPPIRLLKKGKKMKGDSRQYLMETASKLQKTLETFGVNVKVVNVSRGPTVTRYELQPEMGVKVSRIVNLQDDIKLNLATSEIRIEAPIPGKAAVGIEVPNKETAAVMLRDIIDTDEFRESKATLAYAVGKDIAGKPIITDIEKMPHLLIAGATGSGKSVCINTLIVSILYKAKPEDVKMLMIDPKVVELKVYDGIPHLLIPVVTDAKKAAGALNWAVQEMTDRYNKFAAYPGVRDIQSYNEKIAKLNEGVPEEEKLKKMPRIVIIVDELADLMMVASSEVEDAICRLAQLARAAGMHLIIATQRPSVNVITGLIKANMPSRIAFAVTSGVDSRTILDMHGAEKLLGKGDMLFYPQNYPKPARVQGSYVSDEEITSVVQFLTSETEAVEYSKEVEEQIESGSSALIRENEASDSDRDEYFAEAGYLIIEKDKASIGMLQRAFKIGFNRAARIMDQLADAGVVGSEEGTKPRKILMTREEFEAVI